MSRNIHSVLLVLLLIGAQTLALAHSYEHESDTLQETACASCISLSESSAVAVDTGHSLEIEFFRPVLVAGQTIVTANAVARLPRQRGPPNTL